MSRYLSFLLVLIIQQCTSQVTRQVNFSGSGTSLTYSLFFNVLQSQTVTMTYSTNCPNLHFNFISSTGTSICNYCTQSYNNGATYSTSCSLGVGDGQKLMLSDWNGATSCNFQFSYNLSFSCGSVTTGCFDCTNYTTCTSCVGGYYFYLNRCYQYPSYCLSVSVTSCTACQSGYFVLFGVCRLCSSFITNCLYCSNLSTCTTCIAGYALTSTFQCALCSTFMPRCEDCSNNSTCTSCVSGSVFDNSSICQFCTVSLPNCITCSSQTQCQQCNIGYAIVNGSCATCSSLMSDCILCIDQYTCTKCPTGFSVDYYYGCLPCAVAIPECSICGTNGTCQKCNTGFGLYTPWNQSCYQCSLYFGGCEECDDDLSCTKCITGYALNSSIIPAVYCEPCWWLISDCNTCTNQLTCTQCDPTYAITSNFQCASCSTLINNCSDCTNRTTCIQCDAGFSLTSSKACFNCAFFMKQCLDCTDNSTCTQCGAGYLASAGTCKACSIFLPDCTICTDINTCTQCDIGYALNSTNKCRPCSQLVPNCSVCPTNITCQVCVPGYVLFNGQCKTCDLVHSNCNTCVNNVSCSVCNKGFIVNGGGTCIICSFFINHCDKCFDTINCQQCYDPYEVDQNKKCRCKSPLYNVSDFCMADENCVNAYQKNKIATCSFCNSTKLYILNQTNQCVCKKGYTEIKKICFQKCGDGIIITQPCDDNNTKDGDGCSQTCKIETDYLCQILPSGVSKCRFNRDIKLKFDSVWKILPENKGLIYISLASFDANIRKFYESQRFNFSLTSNLSSTITILSWTRNSQGQIVIQIQYNETIEESSIELSFAFSNDTILSNNNFLKFQLKGSNFPLVISAFNEQYELISKILFYFVMGSYVLILLITFSDKFIAVEASNTLQLVFFSLLLIYNSGNWPQSFSTLFPLKLSTGLNQLLYQQKTQQNLKDLTFIKYRYLGKFFLILGICESFFFNNFINCAILFVAFTIFLILFIIKTKKQNVIFQLHDCPQKKTLKRELGKFRRVFRRIHNITFHFSYIMILQVFVSLYVETSYLNQMSPFMMIVNKLTAVFTLTILIITILENYNHFFLSSHDTIVEKYQVGWREVSYKRVYFLYLFLNVFCIILLNNKLIFGYPVSCLLLVASLVYLIYLVVYRPYKHSFLIHGVTVIINQLMYILILAMITLLNFSIKLDEFYHLIFSYTLMGFTFVVVFLAVIRVIIDFKYDANNVAQQIRIEIKANQKIQEQRIANQIAKQIVPQQKPQKKKLSKNDHNTYLYENQKLQAEQIDFLNEIKKKSFLTEWEQDQIYHRIYERKPINWAQENEKEKKYKLLLAKEKQIIERDTDRQEMLRIKNLKANDKVYVDELQNLKEKLRVQLSARMENQVQNKQAKKKKRRKEKEGYLDEDKKA